MTPTPYGITPELYITPNISAFPWFLYSLSIAKAPTSSQSEPISVSSITLTLAISEVKFSLQEVNNKNARIICDNYSFSKKIAYIDGGTSPSAGQIGIYNPGKSPRLSRQIKFPDIKRSCMDEPDPSVIMSNMIIGSAMVGESLHILSNKLTYPNIKGIFSYDAFSESRIYIRKIIGMGGKKYD